MRAGRGLWLLGALVAVGLAGWGVTHLRAGQGLLAKLPIGRRSAAQATQARSVPTCRVGPRDLEAVLLATGTVQPATAHTLMSPMANFEMRVEQVVADGALVKPGEVVVRLGTREAENQQNSLRDQLQQSKDSLDQAKSNGEKQVENATSAKVAAQQKLDLLRAQNKADLERMQAEVDQNKEELTYSDGQLAKMERLLTQGIATRDQRDQERKTHAEREFAYQKSLRALANGKKDRAEQDKTAAQAVEKATLDLTDAEAGSKRSVEAAQHSIDDLAQRLKDQERQIRECILRAEAAGIVLLNTMYDETGQHPIRQGDRVWQGYPLGQIVDPQHLRVACQVDEGDVRRVRAGQEVRLRVGTAQGRAFTGRLESLNSIAVESGMAGRKAFAATVQLQGGSKELKPGVTAWLEIVVGKAKRALAVPHEAIFHEGGRTVVYRRRDGRTEPVPVTLGLRTDLYWAATSGLADGDEICTAKPPSGKAKEAGPRGKATGRGREGKRG